MSHTPVFWGRLDHTPIMLNYGGLRVGPTLFKFEYMWFREEGFLERVKGWWESYRVEGAPSFSLTKKLKLLKEDIKRWNKEIFVEVGNRIARLLEDLKALDKKKGRVGLGEEEKLNRPDEKGEVGRLLISEEVS